MQRLIFVNGNGVEINLTSGNYGIIEWSGFSSADLNIQSQQVPFQDGAVFLDALYNPRELTIRLAINDNNNLEKRYELKRELIAVMNAKLGEGYLYYKNDFLEKRIKVIPQLPIFENKNSNDAGTLKASLSWTAPEFYWEDVEETLVNLPILTNVEIENEGDVPCSVDVELDTWNCKNLTIRNSANDKKIELKNIQDFERVFIKTGAGEKSVIAENMDFEFKTFAGGYESQISYKIIEAENKLIAVCPLGIIFTSENGENWKGENSGVSTDLYSICYAKNKSLFVVVGADGVILTSPDAITWTSRTSGTSEDLKAVCYSEDMNLFVIGGDNGVILTSPDAITWTSRTPLSFNIKNICCSSDLFVAVGTGGNISASNNGTSWTSKTSGVSTDLNDICYSEDKALFIAVGAGGVVLTSLNATAWISRTTGYTTDLNAIIYAKELGNFYAVGVEFRGPGPEYEYEDMVLVSSDGIMWDKKDSKPWVPGTFYGIVYFSKIGYFFLLAERSIDKTIDFNDYKFYLSISLDYGIIRTMCYSKKHNLFVAGGSKHTFRGLCIFSSDGVNWDFSNLDGMGETYMICYIEDKELFFAMMDEGFSISSDAIHWERKNIVDSWALTSICYSKKHNLFVITDASFRSFYYGSDLENWTKVEADLSSNGSLAKVIYSDKKELFFALGRDEIEDEYYRTENRPYIFISSNGTSWIKHMVLDQNVIISDMACSDDLIVVIGYYIQQFPQEDRIKKIYVSKDGTSLEEINDDSLNIPYREYFSVTYVNNLFVILGDRGTILMSIDGFNWTKIQSGFSLALHSIAYSDKGKFFLIGGDASVILKSEFAPENVINKLSSDSDMTFNLEPGNNEITLYNISQKINASLTYRQKYLGV